ncbi:hypothetical protein C8R43DRAFT_1014623 [Mycena crocata]|nr:hypothetical protein C8R43DRAFT_1014623 [Mycena crocata]
MTTPSWNAPALLKTYEEGRNVSFYRFATQPSEVTRHIPILNRIHCNLSLVIWSPDVPDLLLVELWAGKGHRVAWGRHPSSTSALVLNASRLFGTTTWSDVAIVNQAIEITRRGPPYKGWSRFRCVEYQNFVEELATKIIAQAAPDEHTAVIPFDEDMDIIRAEQRWMQGVPPFAIKWPRTSGIDWTGGMLFSVPAGPDGSDSGKHPLHGNRRIPYPKVQGPGHGFDVDFEITDIPGHLAEVALPETLGPTAYAFTEAALQESRVLNLPHPVTIQDIIIPAPDICLINLRKTKYRNMLIAQNAATGSWGVTIASVRIVGLTF